MKKIIAFMILFVSNITIATPTEDLLKKIEQAQKFEIEKNHNVLEFYNQENGKNLPSYLVHALMPIHLKINSYLVNSEEDNPSANKMPIYTWLDNLQDLEHQNKTKGKS